MPVYTVSGVMTTTETLREGSVDLDGSLDSVQRDTCEVYEVSMSVFPLQEVLTELVRGFLYKV